MKSTLILTAFFIAVLTASFGNASAIIAQEKVKVSDTKKDDAAIRANLEQMTKGWNSKSSTEFAKPFAGDSDYVVNNGFHVKGFPASAPGLQHLFDAAEKNSIVKYTVEKIRFLRPDIALVHVLGEMQTVQGGLTQKGRGRITLVMAKNTGKWEIESFQNTPIREFETKEGK